MNTGPLSLDNLARVATSLHELTVKDEPPLTSMTPLLLTPTPDGSTSASSSAAKKRMACVECRQQKSRCDAYEKLPGPCTRCFKKKLTCDLKRDYKRTYKRARIAQIEKEFSELKKLLTPAQSMDIMNKAPTLAGTMGSPAPVPPPLPTAPVNPVPGPAPFYAHPPFGLPFDLRGLHHLSETNALIPNTPSIHRPLDPGVPGLIPPPTHPYPSAPQAATPQTQVEIPDYVLACDDKQLDTVVLDLTMIRGLFMEYVERYHPILPVVDVTKGPERIYKLCPALFWVMMFVLLRRYAEEPLLLLQLSPLVKGVLAEIMILPITRYNPTEEDDPILNGLLVYAIQAFLLYLYWPPITSLLLADSSYNTVGSAMLMAIRIGLQTPVMASTDTPLVMAQENAKTWLACNTVLQTIALAFGFPGFTQFDSLVWNLMRSHQIHIPVELRYMMEVAYFEDQVARTLNLNPQDAFGLVDPSERLPLLKLLARRADELELRMAADVPQDSWRRFQLLCARVHLLTYHFIDPLRFALFEVEKGLVQLYNLAIALVNHLQACQQRDRTFVKYLPLVYILNIWQAGCIIGKLTHPRMKKVVDTGSGKAAYEAAILLAAKALILKHDIAHRLLGIMRNMWQLFRALDAKHMSSLLVNVRGRMAALVFFDCLYLIRDQVGMIKLNKVTDDADVGAVLSGGDDDDDESLGHEQADEPRAALAKSTPGSTTSLGRRRRRSLSHTTNAEVKARRIIRTIPLDPQPILVSGGKRSSIFKVVNNLTSSDGSLPKASPDVSKVGRTWGELPLNSGLEHIELDNFDLNGDLLWKDVDSVMNDFGFNI